MRILGIRRGIVGLWEFPHISTKKGPQGQALLISLSELTLLTSHQVANIKLLGGLSLGKMMDENLMSLDILELIKPLNLSDFSIARWWRTLFPTKSSVLRKLSYFPDKEGKTRIIAILDYWSQSALKPLHSCIYKILKGIKSDYTHNQGGFVSNLPQALEGSYHSIDLSAATDRMPIALQRRIIEYLYDSPEKAQAWCDLLVGDNFSVRMPDKSVQTVSYGAGQPMGAYSS